MQRYLQRLARRLEQARPGINWLRHQPWFQKYATTAVMLVVIYYVVTTAVAWITAPKINMTMSPVAGAVAVLAKPAKRGPIAEEVTYSASCTTVSTISWLTLISAAPPAETPTDTMTSRVMHSMLNLASNIRALIFTASLSA